MFVGGEFYTDSYWLRDKHTLTTDNTIFLNGGKACLIVISDYLLDHKINKILLPSYLCPTIVTTLQACGFACDYYQINPDFSIDLDSLDRKATAHKVVLFINYFGFLHSQIERNYLETLQQRGVMVIEDNAQAGFTNHNIGDFTFNSIRKLAAYDGGYLISSREVIPYTTKYQGLPNRHLPIIRDYRSRLASYLFQGNDDHDNLENLYKLAEKYYESDLVVEGDAREKEQIERLDWKGIKQIRRENYTYLLNLLSEMPDLSPIFPSLQEDNMPLGLPVYLSGVSRDWLLGELGNAGIGLTIHWEELLYDSRLNGNPVAADMASRILTLVTDQRTSHKQMDYLVQILRDRLSPTKSTSF